MLLSDLLAGLPIDPIHSGSCWIPAESNAILGFVNDDKDQIHDETARQSRSALGIGLIIR